MKELIRSLPIRWNSSWRISTSSGVFVGKKTDKESAGREEEVRADIRIGQDQDTGLRACEEGLVEDSKGHAETVLETILKEGDPQKAADIVKER